MTTADKEQQRGINRQKMKMGSHPSGIRNDTYDLVSTLYHSIEAAGIYGRYAKDAEQEGETELSTFFREIQEQERRWVSRAKVLLEERWWASGICANEEGRRSDEETGKSSKDIGWEYWLG